MASTDEMYRDSVIVPRSRFSVAELTRLSLDLMEKRPARYRDVWFFISESEALTFLNAKVSVDVAYAVWRRAYDALEKLPLPMAQLVSIGDDAVLRVRNPDGTSISRVLSGRDPCELVVNGMPVKLLHFGAFPTRPDGKELRIQVFAYTSGVLNTSLGLAVLRDLMQKLPFTPVSVHIRTDPWFISDVAFPVFPAFENARPPTEKEYSSSSLLACDTNARGEPGCRLFERQ
jgi:hypothetical protein